MPKKICFANLKGGVGKTMNSFNIGAILAEDSKVLFVDMDPQGNLSKNVGLTILANSDTPTVYDIFDAYKNETSIAAEEVIYHSPIEGLPNADIIPASISMFKFWKELFGRYKILDSFFQSNKKYLSRYDYIIMDTSPSLGLFNVNAFYAADSIILNTDHDPNSIDGIDMFIGLWGFERMGINKSVSKAKQKPDNIKAILFSKFKANTSLSSDAYNYLKMSPKTKDLLLANIIPERVNLQRASLFHVPINKRAPKSDGTKSYRRVIEELRERGDL